MTRPYSSPSCSAARCRLQSSIRLLPGRPPAVSERVIILAREEAVARDLRKDSCTSTDDVIAIVDMFRRIEATEMGLNPLAALPTVSPSTKRNLVHRIAPIRVPNGGVQNSSRQRALMDSRNALSCAASWPVVSAGIASGKFIHSWDECSVSLNSFNEKQPLWCSVEGRQELSANNLMPASTETQSQRRMLKIGLSKFTSFMNILMMYLNTLTLSTYY